LSRERSAATRALTVLPLALATCGFVVAIDQGSKAIATSLVERGENVELLPFLAIENTRNTGVAFGLGGDVSTGFIVAELCFLAVVLVSLSVWEGRPSWIWLPTGLLIGGALGNLADRVRDGAVTDFIDLSFWPTFNLADTAIVIGVALLLLLLQRDKREERPSGEGRPP
jgi:signal peptidase II